jgi:hypothetical protein
MVGPSTAHKSGYPHPHKIVPELQGDLQEEDLLIGVLPALASLVDVRVVVPSAKRGRSSGHRLHRPPWPVGGTDVHRCEP